MFKQTLAFSSFAIVDLEAARTFYGQSLGLDATDVPGMKGLMQLNLADGAKVLVHPKPIGISIGDGPRIAWFRDPSGSILSVLEEKA